MSYNWHLWVTKTDSYELQLIRHVLCCAYYSTHMSIRVRAITDVIFERTKNNYICAYAQPTPLIFGVVKDIGNFFHHTKNSVRRWCVGGDIIILIVGSFENHVGYCKDSSIIVDSYVYYLGAYRLQQKKNCKDIPILLLINNRFMNYDSNTILYPYYA